MAKPPTPWSVKGVDPEAREAAKIAARRAGVNVGAWLTQVIRQAAAEQLTSGSAQPPDHGAAYSQQTAPPPPPGFAQQPHPQGYGNEAYAQPHPSATPETGHSPPPAPTIQTVFESIQRLSSRIERSEKRTAETIAPIAKKVAELSEQIENARGGDGTSTAPVERAVQKISERLERLEGSHRPGPSADPEYRTNRRKGLFGFNKKKE